MWWAADAIHSMLEILVVGGQPIACLTVNAAPAMLFGHTGERLRDSVPPVRLELLKERVRCKVVADILERAGQRIALTSGLRALAGKDLLVALASAAQFTKRDDLLIEQVIDRKDPQIHMCRSRERIHCA